MLANIYPYLQAVFDWTLRFPCDVNRRRKDLKKMNKQNS